MFSFEFFPPKTPEAAEHLYQTIRELEEYMPSFVSVTYGVMPATPSETFSHSAAIRRAAVPTTSRRMPFSMRLIW